MVYTIKANTDQFVSAIKSAQKSIEDAEKRLESSKKSALDFKTQLSKAQQEQLDSNSQIETQLKKIKNAQDGISQATQNTKKTIIDTKDELNRLNRIKAEGLSLASQGGAMGEAEKSLLNQKIAATKVLINEEKTGLDKKKQSLQEELTSAQKILKAEQDRAKEQTKIAQNLSNALSLQLKSEQEITSEIRKQTEERLKASRAANASSNATVSSARSSDYKDMLISASTTKAQIGANYPDIKQGDFKPISKDIDALNKAYLNASKAQKEFADTTEKSSHSLRSSITPIETVNRSLGAMVATYMSFAFVKDTTQDVLDVSMKFDSLNKVFEAVTGSMSGAERAMSLVRAESDRLGLPVLEAAKGLKGLQAAGMAAGIPLTDLEEQFKAASQATTFFAMSTTESERVFKAWTQILSKDKLMAEELTGQLGESLPGAIAIMARALGYVNKNGLPDTARLMKEMEKGAVDGSDAMEKFGKELLKITDKGILTASQSAMREMNRMQNAIKEFQVSIGEAGLLDAATAFFKSMADFLSGIKTEDLKEFGAVITDTIVPALGMYAVYMAATSKAGQALIASIAPMITTQSVLAKETIATAAAQEKAIFAEKARTGGLYGLSTATTQSTIATQQQTAASIASTTTTQKQTVQQRALSTAMITTNAGATEFSRKQYAMSVAASATTKAVGALTSTLKFALPFLLLEGVMVAWEGLENTVINTSNAMDEMLDDKNLDGVIAKANELRQALEGRQSGGLLTQAKGYVEDLGQYWNDPSYSGRSFFSFREDKMKDLGVADKQAKENLIRVQANFASEVTELGDNAAEQAKKIEKALLASGLTLSQIRGIKLPKDIDNQDLGGYIPSRDLTPQQKSLVDEVNRIRGRDAVYQAKVQAQKTADKNKSGTGGKAGKDPKDTTADEISAIKKKIELQAKEIENELVMANMRSEFGKDELEYYKELNSTAQKQNEIEAELIILMSKKPKKGEEAAQQVKINGLVDEYIGSAKLIEQINAKNVITNKDAVKAIEEMEIAGYKVYEYGKEKNDIEKEYKKLLEQNATIESQTAAQKHKDNRLTFLAIKTEYEANKSSLDLAKDITDVAVEGNQKQRTLEELRHKEVINNLEYEMATASEQDTTRLEQLRIRIALENEIYKQNTSSVLKYINAGFDALEKGIDDTLFDVLTGKFENFGESIVDMFEDFGTQIGRELTASMASEMTGFLKGGVKDLLGLGTSSDLLGYLSGASSIGTNALSSDALAELVTGGAIATADNTLITTGGTEVDATTGQILKKGSDIAQLAESMGKGAQSLLNVGSNLQTLATLPQKLNSIVSFVSNPSGYFSAMSGGSMLGVAGQGFGGFLSGGSAASGFSLANGSAAYNAGYYGGGALAGAAGGYATGFIGDRIFGAQTQASNFGAVGGAIGSLGGLPGMAAGIAIGSLLGGAIGTKKEDNKAIDIFKASSEGVTGQDRTTYKTKSWYGVKTDVSTQTFDEATAKSIEKVIESYDYMLQQLGDVDKIVVENKAFESVANFVDEGITKAFLEAVGQTDVEGVYASWKTYAEGIDKTVNQAFTEAIVSYGKVKNDFDVWVYKFKDDELGALKKQSEIANKELNLLMNNLDLVGVNTENFSETISDMLSKDFSPETLTNIEALTTSFITAQDSQKAYKKAIDEINISIDTVVMKSKGYDSAMLKNIDTIENLTGITMNSISDIENVANSLKGIPNITTDAINAFGSLSDSIVAMKDKVKSSVDSAIKSSMPESIDVAGNYLKFFDTLPTTLADWKTQGEALVNSLGGGAKTIEQMVSDAYTQNLGRKPDEGGFQYWVEQLNSGAIAMGDFLGEFKKVTEAPDNVDLFTLPTVSEEKLNAYSEMGAKLKSDKDAADKAAQDAADTAAKALKDYLDSLRYTSDFIKTWTQWSAGEDTTKQLEASKKAFEDIGKQLGQDGTNVENYLTRFSKALSGGLTQDTLGLWEDLGKGIIDFVDELRKLRDTWQDMATSFGNAADDIRGKTTKSFAEIRAIAPTPDNYQDLITMLNDSRQKEIDNLNEASQLRIDALEKEKDLFLDLSQIIKSINARIIDIAPVNNVYYKTELASVKGSISRGEAVDTSGLSSSVSTYLDKYKMGTATKEDYIRESARVREEIAGVQGYNTTLTDIEKAIKNEEWALKAAIDNVNNSAIAILDGWREFSLENTNRIVEAILSLKVPELATYQPSTQPIGAAGTTPRPTTTNEFSSMTSSGDVRTTRDIVEAGLTAAIGSTPSDAIIDAWTAKAEATSLSAIGIPDNIINGSYATGIDRVPTDRISQIHKDEAVLNRGDAEEWRDFKAGGNPYGGTNAELVGVMIEMRNVMQEMAAELIRTKEEIKEVRAILRKVNQKGDGFNVYPKVG